MTGQPTPNHAATMVAASTTNYSTHGVGAALAARRKASTAAQPVQENRTDDIARVAALYGAPVVKQPQAASQPALAEQRPMRLSELAAAVAKAKRGRRAVAESGDPDGPDAGGYDPAEIVRQPGRAGGVRSGSSASVAASVVNALLRRRG